MVSLNENISVNENIAALTQITFTLLYLTFAWWDQRVDLDTQTKSERNTGCGKMLFCFAPLTNFDEHVKF